MRSKEEITKNDVGSLEDVLGTSDSLLHEQQHPRSRAEHMEWCKSRAMEYVNSGNLKEGFASMMSDLRKHPETEHHLGIELGMMQMMGGFLSNYDKMKHFIMGFN